MRYHFDKEFSIKNLESATFVSALNFPKIIKSGVIQSNLHYYVDGSLMQLILLFRKGSLFKKNNFDFSGIAEDLFRKLESEIKWNVAVVGGTSKENSEFIRVIASSYAGMSQRLFGIDGYQDESRIETQLDGANIVILGLGSPKQEFFAEKLLQSNPNRLVLTCGAFITQTALNSNTQSYYPKWVVKLNVRWLFRAYKEKGHYQRLFYALINVYRSFCHVR